jgi:hypothetical protein
MKLEFQINRCIFTGLDRKTDKDIKM